MSTQAKYIKELTTLVEASAPIIVTRTREPYKAIEAIHTYVRCYNKENKLKKASSSIATEDINPPYAFGRWTCLDGWSVEKADEQILCQEDLITNKSKVKPDNLVDPVIALQALMGSLPKQITDSGAQNLPESGVFVMNWLQPVLSSPKVQACLLEIADRFVANDKCLVLVLPETADIPTELQDFVTFLDYEVPADQERISIIVELLEGYGYSKEEIDAMDLNALSASCAGMTSFEIGNSVSRALFEFMRDDVTVNTDLLSRKTNLHKTEMVKRGDILEVMPMGNMSDIGGLECLKEWIDERKFCFSQDARDFGVDVPKGIALAGPPGSGKSACGKAIGHVLGLPVIKFDISKCFAGIVGQSEARVRSALKQLAALAPCVVGDTEIKLKSGEVRTAKDLYLDNSWDSLMAETVSEDGRIVDVVIHGVLERPVGDKKLFTIVDEYDKIITVTENHKLLIRENDLLLWKEAKDLNIGDDIVCFEEFHS